ncbi:MAG: ABC transporter ATP-binding protein [Planctomycetaceae bacterium]|jgi:ABC-2 type transport system ATP-binding protein|nr:ABC transporter ATP-binding protein [Planctomycetaceae bacterium]
MSLLVETRDLHKRFGGIHAVRGVNLRVQRGEVLGFLGPNGAGKTTTMRMITGFLEPTDGSAWVDGVNVALDPLRAKSRMGYLPEGAPCYPDMRVEEFLAFIARARGYRGSELKARVERAIMSVNLSLVRRQTFETLSKGYRRRTGIAQSLLHDPPVLILDEPTDGLDPNQKFEVRSLIRQLGKDRAIILSTHLLEEVEAVCTRAVIINRGTVVFDGTPAEMDAKAPASIKVNRLDHVFRELTTGDVPGGKP